MDKRKNLLEKLSKTPDIPGVYLMKGRDGSVIYTGKALSLKRRISSYFQEGKNDIKNLALSDRIEDFDFIPVASEAEALILENNLIKKYRPKYNVNLKDDKSYPFVKITAEKYPTLRIVREKKDDRSRYFGPFTNIEFLRGIIKFVRRYYPVRNCRYDLRKKVRLCTQYHIGRCSAPCAGRISRKEYRGIVRGITAFFEGDYRKFIKILKKQLSVAIRNLEFERAQEIKKRLFMLEEMEKRFPIRDEKTLLSYSESNVLPNLKEILKLDRIPYHIEGYDVSNISGIYSTASRISFKGGVKDTRNYRKYRIILRHGIDDCGMLMEVLARRFGPDEDEKKFPDLILVDGGKGQLNTAVRALKNRGIDIPVISLAKRNEEIYRSGVAGIIRLSDDSPELHLLQAVRDEAHRFALCYHRNLRGKGALSSFLDEIPGIGERRKRKILFHFPDTNSLSKASPHQLVKIGIPVKQAIEVISKSTELKGDF